MRASEGLDPILADLKVAPARRNVTPRTRTRLVPA